MTTVQTKMQDSKIPWIWEIPEDWDVKKLKYVFKYITWATPDSWKNNYYNNWNNNWITISDLNWKYTGESKNKITDIAVKEKNMKIVPKWSLLYSFKLSVWQLAFVSKDTYINEAIFAVLEKEWLNLNFWYYALQSYFISNANENIYWAKIFNQFIIDNWFLIIPSIDDQNIISNFLDQKTSQINTFIENKKNLIKLLEEQKISIINKAVTKWLDENVKMKDSWIPWIWEIPEDWKRVKIKHIVETKITDWPHETPEFHSEWVPFASAEAVFNWKINFENVRWYISEEQDKIYSLKCKPQIEDIFIVKSWSTTWKIAVLEEDINFNIWSPLALVRVKKDIFFYKYVFYFFLSDSFQRQVQTFWSFWTQPNIWMWVIENLFISFPIIQKQKLIVESIEIETKKINSAIEKIEKEIKLIEEYRDSLIYQAVTWKLNIQ